MLSLNTIEQQIKTVNRVYFLRSCDMRPKFDPLRGLRVVVLFFFLIMFQRLRGANYANINEQEGSQVVDLTILM